jgi:hypothetical protein
MVEKPKRKDKAGITEKGSHEENANAVLNRGELLF